MEVFYVPMDTKASQKAIEQRVAALWKAKGEDEG
jgi:hypothetical protein